MLVTAHTLPLLYIHHYIATTSRALARSSSIVDQTIYHAVIEITLVEQIFVVVVVTFGIVGRGGTARRGGHRSR